MRTGEKAPSSGTPAPEFTLNSQDGKPLSLRDLRGKWVVLYFYPKDFTSGCTKESPQFSSATCRSMNKKNAIILGVSVQGRIHSPKVLRQGRPQLQVARRYKYAVSSSYDSLVNLGVAKLSARHTFLIDPTGVIRKTISQRQRRKTQRRSPRRLVAASTVHKPKIISAFPNPGPPKPHQ